MSQELALVDFHHTDLYRSFVRLLEDRLGYKVLRPYGLSWTGLPSYPISREEYGRLSWSNFDKNTSNLPENVPSHYPVDNRDYLTWGKASAYAQYDLLICSKQDNLEFFSKYKSDGQVLIRYIGNEEEQIDCSGMEEVDIVLVTHPKHLQEKDTRFYLYTPEISLSYFYGERDTSQAFLISSFLNFFNSSDGHSFPELWDKLVELNSNFYHQKFGLDHPSLRERYQDPFYIYSVDTIKDWMKHTILAFHIKRSEGFGFMMHQLACQGVPMILSNKAKELSLFKYLNQELFFFADTEKEIEQLPPIEKINPELGLTIQKEYRRIFNEDFFSSQAKYLQDLINDVNC